MSAKKPLDVHQYVLPSGLGVRVRRFRPSEKDKNFRNAAIEAGEEATLYDLRSCELRSAVRNTLVQITEVGTYATMADLVEADQKALAEKKSIWRDVKATALEDEWDDLFDSRDDAMLIAIYKAAHEVSADDVRAIVGKALPVSTD